MSHDDEEEEAERLCEECSEILTVAQGSEPTRFCHDCAHEIAERLTDKDAARNAEADKRWAESEQRWAYVRAS